MTHAEIEALVKQFIVDTATQARRTRASSKWWFA